ncbi:AraC family transcriptional regulator [Aliivibrio finisterrensis]|uniref:AraC family transcriptional regulator n=1 Tax=Aliivibrio finisterrensis TaxID=511998 RepID=A0A4Q5KNI8_9GAMM|nr:MULTISPECIES: helix-turn-helix transcriptional regulator [Aliivibrio]MDD9173456.1 helix-turn-helix transcriptional regulator [Aliivibrio sp. S3TY1]MDD9190532.1 helix-turn-helix transcriptional regulator [Aliivibrio sp. S2TY2]RYU47333.1 AraC family transcriptional regulator [Aliivibrio finisterrensis]
MNDSSDPLQLVTKESVRFFSSIIQELDSKSYLLLRESMIPIDIMEDEREYTYLPESCLKNLMEVLSRNVGNDRLGVLFWRLCKDKYIPSFLKRLNYRDDLKSTLDGFSDLLSKESTGAKVYVQESVGSWWLVREKSGVDEPWFKYAEMFSVIFMSELLRSLTKSEWSPTRIGIRSKDDHDFLNLPTLNKTQFFTERPVTALEIPASILFSKVAAYEKEKINVKQDVDLQNMTFTDQFKIAIFPYLPVGKLPIKLASEILRMNVRTLQRKLKNDGTIYKTLIEEMCFEQIVAELVETNKPITGIATKYGYSDAGHFSRAFKRIYGVSPSQYRKVNTLIG